MNYSFKPHRFVFVNPPERFEHETGVTEGKEAPLKNQDDIEHIEEVMDQISRWEETIAQLEARNANPAYIERVRDVREKQMEELSFLYRMKRGMNTNTELFTKTKPKDNSTVKIFLDTVGAWNRGFKESSKKYYYTEKRFESYQKYELKPQLDTIIRSLRIEPVNQELLDQALILNGEKPEKKLEIKGITPEQLQEGKTAIKKGYEKIFDEVRPGLVADVERLGKIRPVPSEYYDKKAGLALLDASIGRQLDDSMLLGLMIKESKLDVDAQSRSGAQGLFQIMPIAEREVQKYYGYTASDILDPSENAAIGILYLHRCRELYAKEDVYSGLTSAQDKDLLAYAIYNKGPGNMRQLWQEIGASTYEDFEKNSLRRSQSSWARPLVRLSS